MGNKMLIDAAHPEETRVVVLRGNRIEEFDFEAANKKQLRGNIYLAKVTRVEPSLQAAFIEYGGNRHGFLAFSEIHPDYYQIPVADRQQLLEDEARSADEDDEEPRSSGNGGGGNGGGHRRSRRHRRGGGQAEKRAPNGDEVVTSEEEHHDASDGHEHAPHGEHPIEPHDEAVATGEAGTSHEPVAFSTVEAEAAALPADEEFHVATPPDAREDHEPVEAAHDHAADHDLAEAPHDGDDAHDHEADAHDGHEEDVVEQIGGDALEDVPHRSSRPRRNYKIQEVIKRRQVLLVQVVKEERGNKGAALTTYLSLAGRYSVLMPNTARGGGISRKIVDPEDRKRLKAIAQELEVPDGMGIILRTAGASRGMPEVKRDFEYLMRMWETVRETTLKSTAPMLVYEEGSLIKRSIRDLFTKDVDEVVVAGDEAYKEAKDFMRLLMPNQVRNVVAWREPQPLFAKAGAEAQLDAMFSNQVVLKSGGYLVINQTEALVAIDVNSGRSTREHNIEDTAVRTNLEAADEIARQLRLRDLAGLIVVDFIDMEEGRNDRAVERRLKDALKNDRARIQIGRISHFGLLEMSRQRMRTGVVEGSTVICAHCAGSGTVRSVSSMALHVLRVLEEALIRSAAYNLIARTRSEVTLYILNQKRANLLDLEARFGVSIAVMADPAMTGMVYHAIERGAEATPPQLLSLRPSGPGEAAPVEDDELDEVEDLVSEDLDEAPEETEGARSADGARSEAGRSALDDGEGGRRRRRRRRRRGRDGQNGHDGHNGHPREGGEEPAHALDVSAGPEMVADAPETGLEHLTDIEAGFLPEGGAPEAIETAPTMPDIADEPPALERPTVEIRAVAASSDAEPTDEAVEVTEPAEAPRRRRTTRRATRGAAETAAADPEVKAEEPLAPPRRARRPRVRAAELPLDLETAVPQTDREVGSETAPPQPAPQPSEPELPLVAAAAAPSAVETAPEPVKVAAAEPEADPDRPKRSGWWQRAKATFSAGS